MSLLSTAGNLDFDTWIRGLLSAGISGGASAVSSGFGSVVLDPKDFNPQTGKLYELMVVTFAFSAFISIAKFLQMNPLPTKTVVTTVQTTEQGFVPPKVVTTVEETHIEPK